MLLSGEDQLLSLLLPDDLIPAVLRKAENGAADPFQKVGVLLGLFPGSDNGDSLAAVQHAVAGGAVADAAAEELRFSRIELLTGDPGGENHALCHIIVAADRDTEAVLHRQHGDRPALNQSGAGLHQLSAEQFGHLRTAHGREPRVVGDPLGLVEAAGLMPV